MMVGLVPRLLHASQSKCDVLKIIEEGGQKATLSLDISDITQHTMILKARMYCGHRIWRPVKSGGSQTLGHAHLLGNRRHAETLHVLRSLATD